MLKYDVLEALKVAHNSNKVSGLKDSIDNLRNLIIEFDKAIG